VVQLAKPNPSNPHVLNMKTRNWAMDNSFSPFLRGNFHFGSRILLAIILFHNYFSGTWIILYKTDTPLPVKYLLVIVGDLSGGSRISSGELDDADDVEGFLLRVLKKGVCIDHF